eukprot:gnl/MRDRNA2_/MRDRNA2_171170_c0_seq1.p1 gnl/MRDRNA2_/MRDRNA2_171170_c0~~gnl/MRDRNA2_/MRDRNA2_171170_c0_seq1.p1  ORF type:complete len:293 (+),score=52.22 gnl/MRDRNA2_/MRDRNA2_171170_c0_seq1:37-915(+)
MGGQTHSIHLIENFYGSDLAAGQEAKETLSESDDGSSSDSGSSESSAGDEKLRPIGVRRLLTLNSNFEFRLVVLACDRDEHHEDLDKAVITGNYISRRTFEKFKMSEDPVRYEFKVNRVKITSSHRNFHVDKVPTCWHVYLTDDEDDMGVPASIRGMEILATAHGMDTDPRRAGHSARGPEKEGIGNFTEVFYTAESPAACFRFEGMRDSYMGGDLTFSFIEPRSRLTVSSSSLGESNAVRVILNERRHIKVELDEDDAHGWAQDMLQTAHVPKAQTQKYCNCSSGFTDFLK